MPDNNAGRADPIQFGGDRTTPEFDTALVQAGGLLEYAAGAGRFSADGKDAASIVPKLIQAQEATRTGTLTEEITVGFWIAYGRLTRLSAPVSAASLAASKQVRMLGMKIGCAVFVLLLFSFRSSCS